MNRNFWYRIALCSIVSLWLLHVQIPVHAQVQDVEIRIANPLKVTMPVAERNFEKIPVKPLEPVYPPLVYGYRPLKFSSPVFRPPIRPLKIKDDNLERPKQGYATVGLGNYGWLLADLYVPVFSDKKNTNNSLLRLNHNSFRTGPVADRRSGSSISSVYMDWRASTKGMVAEATAGFKNVNARFYGYPEAATLQNDTLGINYYDASLQLKFSNNRNAAYIYDLSSGFSYLWNNREASEKALTLGGNGSLKAGKKGHIKAEGEYNLFIREDKLIPSTPRHLAQGSAFYHFQSRGLQADIGLTGAAENDALLSNFFHFYPLLKVNWQFMPTMTLTGNIGGQIDKVSLHNLIQANNWLDRDVVIAHSNELINGSILLKASAGKIWSVVAGVRYADFANLFFFVNQNSDASRFGIVYDDAKKINPTASAHFRRGTSTMELKADYFIWEVDQLAAAYHRPEGQLEWNGSFSFSSKVHFRPYAMFMWGIKAPLPGLVAGVEELPGVTDLGFRFEFNFSERGSVQLRVNNLLGTNYSLLQNYPVRGVQGLAAIGWRF